VEYDLGIEMINKLTMQSARNSHEKGSLPIEQQTYLELRFQSLSASESSPIRSLRGTTTPLSQDYYSHMAIGGASLHA